MNYLFYLGIIVPTLITICLFVVFIYCWFLQKARKEVLTRRYDPHGKMRQLGMSMDPPPPPDFCRFEVTTPLTAAAARLSPHTACYGEDNLAYCVSRSPSTEQQQQQQQRRSLYHTYHDSGISAGGLAGLTSSASAMDNDIRQIALGVDPNRQLAGSGGLSYRMCPDSGISGLSSGTIYGGGNSLGLGATACSQQSCGGYDGHEHEIQQQAWYNDQCQQQFQRHSMYHQQIQQQQMRPQHLHHTLVQATVHPSHGVCYGDNNFHPQSPQHYTPPPHQQHHDRYDPQRLHAKADIQLHQIQMANNVHNPSTSRENNVNSALPVKRYGDEDQVFELVSPTDINTHPKELHGNPLTTETSFGPQGPMDVMVTPSGDPRLTNTTLPAQQAIVLSCLMQQQHQLTNCAKSSQHHQQKLKQTHPLSHHQSQNTSPNISETTHKTPNKPSISTRSSPSNKPLRDSGISEESRSDNCDHQSAGSSSGNNTTSSTSSDRPESQASHSPSTTDSEDSGFRGSQPHCPTTSALSNATATGAPAPTPTYHPSRLNKQTNPLLKPMRRPRTKTSRKNVNKDVPLRQSKTASPNKIGVNISPESAFYQPREPYTIANTESSAPGSPTPLITLDPQNLNPPPLSDLTGLRRGLEMIDFEGQEPGLNQRLPSDPSANSGDQLNRTEIIRNSRKSEGHSLREAQSGLSAITNTNVTMGDISTHLSWSYLQGLSQSQGNGNVASPHTVRGEGAPQNSVHLRHDLHPVETLGYSVV